MNHLKMDFFKKPLTAIIIAVILCSGILVVNTQVKLGNEIDAVEDAFFDNVDGQRSIYTRLQEKLQAVNGVWTILSRYDEDAALELSYEQDYLQWACDSANISSMFYANEDLNSEFNSALRTLDGCELTDDEKADLASYVESFNGAQKMIDENSYNSQVLDFIRSTYNKFPTKDLAEFAGVYPPETFS